MENNDQVQELKESWLQCNGKVRHKKRKIWVVGNNILGIITKGLNQ